MENVAEKGQLRDFLRGAAQWLIATFPGPGYKTHRSGASPGSLILTRLRFTQSNALASW